MDISQGDVLRASFSGIVGFLIGNYVQQLIFSEALFVGGICFVSYLAGDIIFRHIGATTAYTLGIAPQ